VVRQLVRQSNAGWGAESSRLTYCEGDTHLKIVFYTQGYTQQLSRCPARLGAAPRRTTQLTFLSAAESKILLSKYFWHWKVAESPYTVILPNELQYEDRMEVLLQR